MYVYIKSNFQIYLSRSYLSNLLHDRLILLIYLVLFYALPGTAYNSNEFARNRNSRAILCEITNLIVLLTVSGNVISIMYLF